MTDQRKRRKWPMVVLALLVLYPLSIGPLVSLNVRGYLDNIPAWLDTCLAYYGAPIDWVVETFPSTERLYFWYCELWIGDVQGDIYDGDIYDGEIYKY